ncbi:DUF6089 family protein [Mucilaginibacter sp. RS28]|uniref:DUF6089 family protein n=1 Tax=Mucilaginibacter straminoryzae TaxID=2932774 RepID=A0A9X2B915_9SPHI|nr:DUF6089 family protein [Mucilaginibacter straminoryzae]MCJ8210149.1 DUF6089 family protein [Mucilaginibacter straminoryzae]
MLKKLLLFSLALFSVLQSMAQKWDIGISGGGSGYMGDLNQRNVFQVSGPAVGGFVRRNFSDYVSAKIGFMHGQVVAADRWSSDAETQSRNLSFFSNLDELAATVEFNFMKFRPGIDLHAFTPYVFAGIGAVNFNPKAYDYNGNLYELRPLMTEGQSKPYPNVVMTIPFGAGVKYNFYRNLSLSAEAGYRIPNTDYLDDVSGMYANPTNFTAKQKEFADRRLSSDYGSYGTQRGDGRSKDTYMFFTVSLTFTFLSSDCYFTNSNRYR